MKIVQINGGVFGSTGKIMFGIADCARKYGHEVICAAPVTETNRFVEPKDKYIKIGTFFGRCISVFFARITGFEGCFSYISTIRLLYKIKKFTPDIVHLHSIHNSYINFPLLFWFLKRKDIKVIWTLHDCWAFTGHCPHFEYVDCKKWKKECERCKKYREYPKSYFDNSKKMYRIKRKVFLKTKEMIIITPSSWLASKVKESYLKDYQIKVVNNGINLSVFRPIKGSFRKLYNCENKYILLGVSFGWDFSKGLDIFIQLAKELSEEFQIVLVGTNEMIDRYLPPNIISIHRTESQKELVDIYSESDLFINPTREDTFPTVNMEALACGTPVITFETGGSPEVLNEECGKVIKKDDYDALKKVIIENKTWKNKASEACIRQAKKYDMYNKFDEIVKIYQSK